MSWRFCRAVHVRRNLPKTWHIPRGISQRWISSTAASDGPVEECDVVIVGGGPAGLAFASALVSSQPVRESLSIALIEAGDLSRVRSWKQARDTFSNRVSSLTNASKNFLDEIGAWAHVDKSRTTPIEEMQVWDGISDSRITFSAAELMLPAHRDTAAAQPTSEMAHMTENLNLQRALLHSLEGQDSLKVLDNVKVSRIDNGPQERGGWPLVHTSDGRVLRARLLVGADGFNSPVRAYAGIESYGWAYDTRAIVATLIHVPRVAGLQAPNTTAYQRFLPTGPIAFLPLSPTASSLVWSTTPALAAALTTADPAFLAAMVNAAFRLPHVSVDYLHNVVLEAHANGGAGGLAAPALLDEIRWRESAHGIAPHSVHASATGAGEGVPPAGADALPPLVTAVQPGSAASFPLRLSHADAYIGDAERGRTVLLGDAAHTIHPLAGQGLNMGLADAQALARCIHKAVTLGNDIGSHTALQPYARNRYFENHKLLSVTDKLHKLYSSTLGPVVWARSVGLEVVDELDALKAAIMMSAGANVDAKPGSPGAVSGYPDITGWNMATVGIEILAGGFGAAKLVGKSLGGKATDILGTLLNPRQ